MKVRRVLLLVIFCLMISTLPVLARALQAASPLVAFVNSSGQLIVSSGDGSYRWIVTNPGEKLAGNTFWFQGHFLYFAVAGNGNNAVRIADISSQQVSDGGQIPGLMLSRSADNSTWFYQQSDGGYGLSAESGDFVLLAPLKNDVDAPLSGLWSDVPSFVAYWGYSGNSILAVTDELSNQTVMLDSGRSAPITPLMWRPNTTQLIFRDATGSIRLADLACVPSGCASNPLDSATTLATADADIAVDGTSLYFRNGNSVSAVNLNCASSDNCANSAVVIAGNAAPQTVLNAAGNTLVYTAYEQNANDPSDREVRTLDLGCVSNPSSCAPQTVLTSAVAGAISADGQFTVVEQASGLSTLDLSSGATAYLSDKGATLDGAVWQP